MSICDTLDAAQLSFLRDVVTGLSREPKTIHCKHLYDAQGSALFDQITELEEYYLTRAELEILATHADDFASLIGPRSVLIELGSGSSVKTRVLLDHLVDIAAYVPVDISEEHLLGAAEAVNEDYPDLTVLPAPGDYTQRFDLPELPPHDKKVAFFPGSTVGNFEPEETRQFLRQTAKMVGVDGGLLIGVDLVKDARTLEAAYDDEQGVTAEFSRNLLRRINSDLDGTIDPESFEHRAVWNLDASRIEISLVSTIDQEITVAGHRFSFEAGEMIYTENSYKYTLDSFARLATEGGFRSEHRWLDADARFSIHYLVAGN